MRRVRSSSMGAIRQARKRGVRLPPVSSGEGEWACWLAFEHSKIGIVFLDLEGRILRINPEMTNFLGYAEAELEGCSILEVTHPDDLLASRDCLERAVQGDGQSLQIEKRYRHKQGQTLWGLATYSAICGARGRSPYLILQVQDISQRKRLEAEQENLIGLMEALKKTESFRDVIREALLFFQALSECEAVGIRLHEGDDYPYFETLGFSGDFVRAEKYLCGTDLEGQVLRDECGNPILDCMCGNILCGRFDPSKPFFTPYGSFRSNCTSDLLAGTSEQGRMARTRNRCNGEGYESVALIPLRSGGETLGLLQFNDRRRGRFSPEMFALLERLAAHLAMTLAERRAREQMQESEARYRRMTEAVTDYLYRVRIEEGRVLETRHGEGCVAVTGYSVEEFARDPHLWMNMVAEADRSAVRDLSRRVAAGAGDLRIEHRIVRKDGTVRWVLNTLLPRRNVEGGVSAYDGLIQDITERKEAEEALRDRELRFRTLFESAPVLIWEEDFSALRPRLEDLYAFHRDGLLEYLEAHIEEVTALFSQVRIVDANRRTLEFFGVETREEISKCLEGCFHRSSLIVFARELEALITGKTQFSSEIPVCMPSGEERILVFRACLVSEDEKDWSRVYVSLVDITERKRLERKLLASESRYRSIVEEQTDIIFRVKPDGTYSFVNERFCEVFWKIREHLVGAAWFPETDPPELNVVSRLLSQPTVRKPIFEMECRVRDGQLHWCCYHLVSRGIFDLGGRMVEVQVVGRDITKQKLYEEALHRNQELTQRILNTVPELVYIYDLVGKRNLYVNQDLENFPGNLLEHLWDMGTGLQESLLHPEDVANVNHHHLTMENARDEEILECDCRIKNSRGEWRHLHCRDTVFLRDSRGRVCQILGTVQDVTERKRAETALVHAHDLMRYVIENANSAIAIHDRDLRYIYVSSRYLRDYNVREKDVIGRYHYDVFPDLPQKWRDVHQLALAGVSSSAEEDPYFRADGSVVWTRWLCRPWFEPDGSVGGIILYTEVITERKQMEQALRESEELFSKAFYNGPLLMMISDLESGRFLKCNASFLQISGFSPDECIGKISHEIGWISETERQALKEELLTAGRVIGREIALHKKTGETIWCLYSGEVFVLNGEKRILSVLADITDRKKLQDALQASENRFRSFMDNSPALAWAKDETGRFVYYNRSFLSWFAITETEWIGKQDREIWPADIAEKLRQNDLEVLASNAPVETTEEVPGSGGKIYRTLVVKFPFQEAGGVRLIGGVALDITQRVQMEEQLRRYMHIVAQSRDLMALVDRNYVYLLANDAFAAAFSTQVETIEGKRIGEMVGQTYFEEVVRPNAEICLRDRLPVRYQNWLELPGSGKRFLDVSYTPYVGLDDQVKGFVVAGRDITELRRFEDKLRLSEKFTRSTLDSLAAHIAIVDRTGTIEAVNKGWIQFAETNGINVGAVCEGTNYLEVCERAAGEGESNVPEFLKGFHEVLEGRLDLFELEYPCHSPEEQRWFNVRITRFPGDAPHRVVVAHQDCTARKLAEEALRVSEERLTLALSSSGMGIFEWDMAQDLRIWDPTVHRLLGTDPERFSGRSEAFFAVMPPEDREVVRAAHRRAMEEKTAYETEYRAVWPDGSVHYIAVRGKFYFDSADKPYRLLGVCWDITERKNAEEALRASQNRYRLLFESMSSAFALHEVLLDGEGTPCDYRFLEVNPAFEVLAGFRREQIVGRTIREVLPETENFWIEQYGEVALTGKPVHFERWSNELDRYYEITAYSPQRGQFAVIFLDLTERKRMDDALKASWEQYRQLVTHLDTIREEERKGIAREIHDELGQALTAFRLDISRLQTLLKGDQALLREKLVGMVKDVETMTDIVHRISSELRPGMLDDLGIGAAADWLVQDFASRSGLTCEARIEPDDLVLEQNVSTALYRILQEALTNIARHALAETVRVRLEEQEEEVLLEIEDDGVGILPEQAAHRQSWGIIGMQERVRALNGEFSITGNWDRGTQIRVRIPRVHSDEND